MTRTFGIVFLFVILLASSPVFAQAPEVGDRAPDFALNNSEGKEYKLSDFRGKKAVVVEFFRSGGW